MTNRVKIVKEKRTTCLEGLENGWHVKIGNYRYFLCSCGETCYCDEGMLYKGEAHRHVCPSCGNRSFFDSVKFLYTPDMLYWEAVRWRYVHTQDAKGWHTLAVVHVPLFNTATQSIVVRCIEMERSSLLRPEEKAAHFRFLEKRERIFQKEKIPSIPFSSFPGYRKLDKTDYFRYWRRMLRTELKRIQAEHLQCHLPEPLRWMEGKTLPVRDPFRVHELFTFFIYYEPLRSFEFFFWNYVGGLYQVAKSKPTVEKMLEHILFERPEKSVRRTFYENYAKAMADCEYDPRYDYCVTRFVRDPNFLVALLSRPMSIKSGMCHHFSLDECYRFFLFLFSLYPEKKAVHCLLSLDEQSASRYLVRDTIRMLLFSGSDIRDELVANPPQARFEKLHDALIEVYRHQRERERAAREARRQHRRRLQRLIEADDPVDYTVWRTSKTDRFDYAESIRTAAVSFEGLRFALPETPNDLEEWANILHNCLFGYAESIYRGTTLVFGVFVGEELRYAVEICDDQIVQALGKFNRTVKTEDMKVIRRWFEKVYLEAV